MSDSNLNYNTTPLDNDGKVIGLNYNPNPSERELEWDKSKILSSKTDSKGNILYANEAFIDVCGYDDHEISGKPHNILRHPDMPKIIFKKLWEKLSQGEHSSVIAKNLSKTGRYYWTFIDIDVSIDASNTTCFTGKQKAVSNNILNVIEPLYRKLLSVENANGIEASENFLIGYLEERNKTSFSEYVLSLLATGHDSSTDNTGLTGKKKGFFSGFFAEEGKGNKRKQ